MVKFNNFNNNVKKKKRFSNGHLELHFKDFAFGFLYYKISKYIKAKIG